MLTPAKIKNHHFEASGRNGYKADSVDMFFEEVAESYEQMFRENGEMFKKINLLAERLEEYRTDENNIRDALLTAQRMADQITRETNEKSEKILDEANAKAKAENAKTEADAKAKIAKANEQANTIVSEAKKQAEKILFDATHDSKEAAVAARNMMIKEEASLQMLQVEVSRFKKRIIDAYNAQFSLIEQLPEITKPEEEKADDLNTFIFEEENLSEPEITESATEDILDEDTVSAADSIDVSELQQMIYETEDTDADENLDTEDFEDDSTEEDVEEIPDETDEKDFVIPDVEEKVSDEDLDRIVNEYTRDNKKEDSKPSKSHFDDDDNSGFKVNLDQISAFASDSDLDEDSYLDELDEDDDDDDDEDDDGLTSKLKGFFRK